MCCMFVTSFACEWTSDVLLIGYRVVLAGDHRDSAGPPLCSMAGSGASQELCDKILEATRQWVSTVRDLSSWVDGWGPGHSKPWTWCSGEGAGHLHGLGLLWLAFGWFCRGCGSEAGTTTPSSTMHMPFELSLLPHAHAHKQCCAARGEGALAQQGSGTFGRGRQSGTLSCGGGEVHEEASVAGSHMPRWSPVA